MLPKERISILSSRLDVCLIDLSLCNVHNKDMKGFYREFGRRLRENRRKAGLTQETLAKRVGLSRTSITNIEHGNQYIQLHMFVLLSSALGCEPQELLPIDLSIKNEVVLSSDLLEGLAEEEQEWVRRTIRAGTTSVKEDQ